MPVTSIYVMYVGNTCYDLRHVVSWWDSSPQTSPASVCVRFQGSPDAFVVLDKATFDAAMAAAAASYTLTINNSKYDLRKVVSWWDSNPQTVPPSVAVRFHDIPDTSVLITKTVFEAAMQTAQDAGAF